MSRCKACGEAFRKGKRRVILNFDGSMTTALVCPACVGRSVSILTPFPRASMTVQGVELLQRVSDRLRTQLHAASLMPVPVAIPPGDRRDASAARDHGSRIVNCFQCWAAGNKVPATKRAAAIGGPSFHLCDEHTAEMLASAREACVSIEIEMLDPPTGGPV